jgi:glutamine synthetase
MGVTVEHIHKEGPLGQFELVIKYDEVTKSVCNYFLTREAISSVLR